MAEKITVKAEKREEFGKNINRRLRVAGKVPVIIYGGGNEPVSATAQLSELAAIIRSDSGINSVFSIDVAGDINDVIFQDRQVDVLTGRLLHADLRRFAKGEKIEMTVQVHIVGEPTVELDDDAVVTQAMREIKVLCEPAKTPEFVEADISELRIDRPIQVSDIKVPEGVEIVDDPETVVVTAAMQKEVELEPQVAEGAEPEVAGEAPAEEGEGGE
ncbi:MAG: 50S ribosomal protein L25 [Acidobacteria bacterium]|nr:50S ribosomal protein L25 [Acidobacteriota bacterium]